MISPELLRRYPFFGFMTEEQFQKVAMISEEIEFEEGEVLFESGAAGDAFYLLIDGAVELSYVVFDQINPELCKEFQVGDINPGEVFGVAAVIAPRKFTATAKATMNGQAIEIDADALLALCGEDAAFGYGLMAQVAKATAERLGFTRTQLAAAWNA